MAKSRKRKQPVENIHRVPIADLTPYMRNPKTHPPEQIDLIAESLKRYGQTQIVLISGDARDRGNIIAGHGRVLAAEQLGWTEVMVGEAHGWTDDDKKAYRIADNELGSERLAPYDLPLLRAELSELTTAGFDMPLIGFSQPQLSRFTDTNDQDASPQLTDGLSYAVIVRCKDEHEQRDMLKRFKREGLKVEALIS